MNNAEIAKCLAEVSALVAAGLPYEKCVQSRFTENMAKRNEVISGWCEDFCPTWNDDNMEFRVAKGFVEGKPVFAGMTIYKCGGEAYIVQESGQVGIAEGASLMFFPNWSVYTLTPPAPKVEIPEGFTEWHGGKCPVADDTLCDLLFADGELIYDVPAYAYYWSKRNDKEQIIAYKIHKPTTYTLNGEVLPLPDCVRTYPHGDYWHVAIGNDYWAYANKADADKVRAAFAKLTEGL